MPFRRLRKTRLYWNTLRYLPPGQIRALVKHRLKRVLPAQPPESFRFTSPVPEVPLRVIQRFRERYRYEDSVIQEARDFARGTGEFKGKSINPNSNRIPWETTEHGRLWQFELHYLDALVPLVSTRRAEDRALAAELLCDWRNRNPAPMDPGWSPYPLSKRMINLARCLSLGPDCTEFRNQLVEHLSEGFGV